MLSVNDKLSDKNGIGIGRKGTIDKPQLLKAPFWTVDTLFYLTSLPNHDLLFLYYLIQKINWKKFDESTGVPSLSKKTIEGIVVHTPNTDEQELLGRLFKKIDITINLHQRKINILKKLKQQYLSLIFPKNNKNIPGLRFMNFKEAWEQRKLSAVLKVNSGKDYQHLSKGNIPVYGTGGYMLSVNDKLSNIDGIGIGRKGTINKPQFLKAPFWTVDTLFYLTSLSNHDLLFLYYLIQKINWKKFDESTCVPSLSKKTIEGIVVHTPDVDEQVLLGRLFKTIDIAINIHHSKLNQLDVLKKSYLHKMFL